MKTSFLSPHNLRLYQRAVQHPQATVQLLLQMHKQPGPGATTPARPATRLREDFAGSALLAATWVALDENHRALAIDNHLPTFRWAARHTRASLGPRAQDLHLLLGDVKWYAPPRVPRVDVIAALNYSTFIYHDRASLRDYFRLARRNLREGGVLVMDAFGPPTSQLPRVSQRKIPGDPRAGVPPFTYHWRERQYDPLTGRVDCRMHFAWRLPNGKTRRRRDAFVYDWRWWTLPELTETMQEAGFSQTQFWMHQDAGSRVRPVQRWTGRGDYHAYVVGRR